MTFAFFGNVHSFLTHDTKLSHFFGFFRNIPSPPPSIKQNLHKIPEDSNGEGAFEDMDQDWCNSSAIPLNPPDISVTDEQGNVSSHSHFHSCLNLHSSLHLNSFSGEQINCSLKGQRSRTFTTLADAYEHGKHLPATQEVNDVNNDLSSPNGFFTTMAILHNSYEDIVLGCKNADEIIRRLRQVLDSQHIAYEMSSCARVVLLNHSNVQLRMEIVNTGTESNSLRFRHVSGDCSLSRRLCHELLEHMSL